MLPFIVGIAVGAVAVVAVNNRKEIKEKVIQGASKVKDKAVDVKKNVVTKVESLKAKDKRSTVKKQKVTND